MQHPPDFRVCIYRATAWQENTQLGIKILCLHSPVENQVTKEPSGAPAGLSGLHIQGAEIPPGECDAATLTPGKIRGKNGKGTAGDAGD